MATRSPERRHAAGKIRPALFLQDEIWIDRHGRQHRLDEMSHAHRRSLIAYLDRWASTTLTGGGSYTDAELDDQAVTGLLDWCPLVRRLHELSGGEG